MSTAYTGFNSKCLTFKAAAGLTAGVPVKMSANDTVAPCVNGDTFCGVCSEVRNGYASVYLTGVAVMPYSTTVPVIGYCNLSANSTGGVDKASSGGRSLLVLNVDTAAKTSTFLF